MLKETFPVPVWISLGALYTAVLLFVSLKPSTASTLMFPHADKLLHAAAHALFCVWLWPLVSNSKAWLVLLASFLLGCNIEIFQQFSPGRYPDSWDLAANICGAIAAYYAMSGRFGAYIESMLQRNA